MLDYVQEHVIFNFEVLPTESLKEFYLEKCDDPLKVPDKRSLVDAVIGNFAEKISVWTPKHGCAFLFNNEVEKGYIIEVLKKSR